MEPESSVFWESGSLDKYTVRVTGFFETLVRDSQFV